MDWLNNIFHVKNYSILKRIIIYEFIGINIEIKREEGRKYPYKRVKSKAFSREKIEKIIDINVYFESQQSI